jgi:hypothetical protein
VRRTPKLVSSSVDVESQDRRFVRRRVALPGGGILVIRPVAAGDVDGLSALYAGLDHDSLYRRFFSIYRPDRMFFERMVAVAERGGVGLVAAVTGEADSPDRIVGEAGCELLPNGDGELAIVVDRGWRGWLGPYLLDALVAAAASQGVPNLEADILMTNGPMLALLHSRGYAAMPNDDWTVMRAMIGTATRMPSWPDVRHGLRVLVEGAGGHWHATEGAQAAGLEVLGCPGPAARRSRCPVLAGEPCPLAAGADVIVISHPLDTSGWRALRAAHAHLHPGVPVCVESPGEAGDAAPEETIIAPDADVVAIVRCVAEARNSPPLPNQGA